MRQNSHAGATASASEHNAEYAKDSQPDTSIGQHEGGFKYNLNGYFVVFLGACSLE